MDMAQKLNKKKRAAQVPLENVTIETEHDSESESKHSVSGVEVDSLLKAQETRLQTLRDGVDKRNGEKIHNHSQTLIGEVSQLRDVSKERHELFAKQLEETKVCLQTQISNIRKLLEI
ncbi:unnamed protein product [Lactuca virosa]|uniref:Uncharacterized protein n=1 Tax=Lactuca virosa TaxID=75947 RepID=A0AAU9PK96_9ASTR|nr:unnamed protein product [Lactuca virosa]